MDFKKKILIKSLGAYVNLLAMISRQKAGEKAFDIFCTPRKGRLNDKQEAFLKTASRWDTLDWKGVAIQCYEWEGMGEKILLAHGWESNSARWQNMVKSLQKADFHIIALDAPGHGSSGMNRFHAVNYTCFINEVCKHFDVKHIVAHSVGAFATIFYLYEYENKIEKVVSLGTPYDLSIIFGHYWAMLGYSEKVRKAMLDYVKIQFRYEVSHFKLQNLVKNLHQKALIIHDKDDIVCPFEGSEAVHLNWQNSTFIVTEKLGHGYQDRKVYHAVRDFLKS